MQFDLAVAHRFEFAFQQGGRGTVVLGTAVGIDHHHASAGAKRRAQVPQKGIGFGDFMVHMNHEHAVEAVRWQLRIVGFAQPHADIVEPFARDALRQCVANLRDDILGQHAAVVADALRQTDGVIALARADIGDGHAGRDPGLVHHQLGFVQPVARFLGRPACRHDRRHRPVGFRKDRLVFAMRIGGRSRLRRVAAGQHQQHERQDVAHLSRHPRHRPSRRSRAATGQRP